MVGLAISMLGEGTRKATSCTQPNPSYSSRRAVPARESH
jgi:hypothetical protein